MAIISSQTTRTSGRAQNYAKKDAVAISAVGASVQRFEQRLAEIRRAHGKDGLRPRARRDGEGRPVRDDDGKAFVERDAMGRPVYESKYVEAYSLVQSFGHDELDPDDPESWSTAQRLGRAVAEDRFPGHPVLIATEVNGRSGCVHNHLIVGAVHAETGRSIDSNVVTHARLSIEHDRVLAEQGFIQREDMRALVTDAKHRMSEARAAVVAEHEGTVSESQLSRKITAAENRITLTNGEARSLQQAQRPSTHQMREDRRQREYHRYELREQECDAALDIGAAPPPEKFSEIVLESRIRETLNDPRVQSWDDATPIGRENGVTIARRGKDVSYGMMLADEDGALADPARAHTRRGKSLGDGFCVADVDEAIDRNVRLQRVADRRREEAAIEEALKARLARDDSDMQPMLDTDAQAVLDSIRQGPVEAEKQSVDEVPDPEPKNPGPVAEPSAFRSGLRGIRANGKGSDRVQQRIEGMARVEEDFRGMDPDAEFERRVKSLGIGPQFLRVYGKHLDPEIRQQLEMRADARAAGEASMNEAITLSNQHEALREQRDRLRETGEKDDTTGWMYRREAQDLGTEINATNRRITTANERTVEIRDLVRDGRYDDAMRAVERHAEKDEASRRRMQDRAKDYDSSPSAADEFSADVAAAKNDRGPSIGR